MLVYSSLSNRCLDICQVAERQFLIQRRAAGKLDWEKLVVINANVLMPMG
jgi:hypothetical protein